MEIRDDVREFLMTRRANIGPEQAGLTVSGQRRVPGLRRSEVAMLADVSPEYYAKIERGSLAGVSDAVLTAISRALQLDDAEHEHLFDLARIANGGGQPVRRRRARGWEPRESLVRALEAITDGPAFVRNERLDLLAVNDLARVFYREVFDGPGQGNLARHCFLDERAREFYPDWDKAADITVAILRTGAGHDPRDPQLHDLIGELSTRCDAFRTRWGAHDVRRRGSHPDLRGDGADRGARAVPDDLRRTARLAQPGAPGPAGQPGGHRPGRCLRIPGLGRSHPHPEGMTR